MLHSLLSWAFLFASPNVVFMACSSEIIPLRHEFFRLPLFLFPWCFHSKGCFVMLLFAFLSVCPVYDVNFRDDIERVSDCCLKPSDQSFSYITTRTSNISTTWWWCPLILDQILSLVQRCSNIPLKIIHFPPLGYRHILIYQLYLLKTSSWLRDEELQTTLQKVNQLRKKYVDEKNNRQIQERQRKLCSLICFTVSDNFSEIFKYFIVIFSAGTSHFRQYYRSATFVRLTRWVPLVKRELLTIPKHLSSPPVFSGVRVTRSLVLCVCFVGLCFSFSTFFFWPLCCLSFFDLRIMITRPFGIFKLLLENIIATVCGCIQCFCHVII